MNSINARQFIKLEYRDPRDLLIQLRKFEAVVAATDTPAEVRTLRTNSLKPMRELREAAIFCYLMSERLRETIYFSPTEDQDYDFMAMTHIDNTTHFFPVQIKEFVPATVNETATLDSVLNSLKKYPTSNDLTIAIHLNRQIKFDVDSLDIPQLKVGGVWMFGALDQSQSEWGLWGDCLNSPLLATRHKYPTEPKTRL